MIWQATKRNNNSFYFIIYFRDLLYTSDQKHKQRYPWLVLGLLFDSPSFLGQDFSTLWNNSITQKDKQESIQAYIFRHTYIVFLKVILWNIKFPFCFFSDILHVIYHCSLYSTWVLLSPFLRPLLSIFTNHSKTVLCFPADWK